MTMIVKKKKKEVILMKEIIHNHDNLTEADITDVVIRVKGLIINNESIILANANNIYQFPGGHLEYNETIIDCLKREVMEETGIDLDDNEIKEPILKEIYMNEDYPIEGKITKSEVYFYVIETNKTPNIDKVKYTDREIKGNFHLDIVPLKDAISTIENNIPKNKRNEVIAPEMITAIKEYLKR